jgi:hypothetical protein
MAVAIRCVQPSGSVMSHWAEIARPPPAMMSPTTFSGRFGAAPVVHDDRRARRRECAGDTAAEAAARAGHHDHGSVKVRYSVRAKRATAAARSTTLTAITRTTCNPTGTCQWFQKMPGSKVARVAGSICSWSKTTERIGSTA